MRNKAGSAPGTPPQPQARQQRQLLALATVWGGGTVQTDHFLKKDSNKNKILTN